MHRRKGVGAERPARARKSAARVRRHAAARVMVPGRAEMVLIRRPQGTVAVLLQLDEGALRDRRRAVRLVVRRRRPAEVPFRRHRRRAGRRLLVHLRIRPPEGGTQIGEVQRSERLVVHLAEFGRRPEGFLFQFEIQLGILK